MRRHRPYKRRKRKISPRYLYSVLSPERKRTHLQETCWTRLYFYSIGVNHIAYSKYLFLLWLKNVVDILQVSVYVACVWGDFRAVKRTRLSCADSQHLISRCVCIFPFCHRMLYLGKKISHSHTHMETSSSVPQYLPSPPCTEGRWGSGVRAGAKWKSLWALISSK